MNIKRNVLKILITFLVTLGLIIAINNISYAEGGVHTGEEGIEEIVKRAASGDFITLMDDEINLVYDNMKNRQDDIYCVDHGQEFHNYENQQYWIYNYIEIIGNDVKLARNYNKNFTDENTRTYIENHYESGVLASILSGVDGKYSRGYYYGGQYSDTQLGLYDYWTTWVQSLNDLGYDLQANANPWNVGSGGTTGQKVIADAKDDYVAAYQSGIEKYKVQIFILKTKNENKIQDLIIVNVEKPTVTTEVTVNKQWVDENDKDGIRPDSIWVTLYANGVAKQTDRIYKESTWGTWTHKFTDLPLKDENGNNIIYTVEEDAEVEGYVSNVTANSKNNFTITNTHVTDTTELKVNKVWVDNNNRDGKRPSSISVTLLANDEARETVTLSKSNNWTYTFKNLQRQEKEINIKCNRKNFPSYVKLAIGLYADGKKVNEIKLYSVNNWSETIDGLPVINSDGDVIEYTFEILEQDSIYDSEPWEDEDSLVQKYEITMTEELYSIQYSVREDNVPSGYTATIDENDEETEFTITNEKPNPTAGNVTISGTVWEDHSDGKGNNNDNRLGSNDSKLEGIVVHWRDSSGNIIASTTTDKNGYYSMSQKIKVYNHTYSIDDRMYNKLNNSYVEFEYNGLKYTTVATGRSSSIDASKAKENATSRKRFDDQFDEITNQGVLNSGNRAYRLSYNTGNQSTLIQSASSLDGGTVTAETKSVLNNLLSSYARTETSRYCYKERTRSCSKHGSHTTHYYRNEIDEWHIENVNLGLVLREQPDIALTSDIEQVRVIMKNQEYTYKYNSRGITEPETPYDYKVKFEQKYMEQTYKRPVSPSDIAYINDPNNNSEDLQVYVKYNIIVKNQSSTLSVKVQELVNYYDANYEIYNSPGWANTSRHGQTYSNNGFKAAYSETLNGTVIEPGKTSNIVSIEFKVNNETLKGLLTEDAPLRNITEINIYSTFYGSATMCSESTKASSKSPSRAGNQYAGIDMDSQPGNAIPGNQNTYEDDTDQAPTFLLVKDPNYKIISGTVWEDKKDDSISGENERLGNGAKANNENVVKNVKVELHKANADGSLGDLAYLYSDSNYNSNASGANKKPIPAITYTDENGHYAFGYNSGEDETKPIYYDTDGNSQDANYSKIGVVTDNYIIKYTYGNNTSDTKVLKYATTIDGSTEINARNYKSTIITDNSVKGVVSGTSTSDKWHLTTQDNYSIAVDDLTERLGIESLKNSNFTTPVNMSAYTKPFRLQVEYTEDQNHNVNTSGQPIEGGTFANESTIFDFGIIERPREDIVIDKTISNLKITLANGQILIDGDPYNEKLNYVKALGNTITNRNTPKNKLVSIEIDSELIHGAKMDMTYAITVTNNSEHDYDYELGNTYYYFGEKGSLPLITTTIEEVVDYVDDELTVTTDGENGDWTKYENWDYLTGNGYIKSEMPGVLENQNYSILTTTGFDHVTTENGHNYKTIYMHVSKLLGNQEKDYTYENHVEIIKLGGKIARTIDSVESDGTQNTKLYTPGNYEPKEGDRTHEYDDDRIIVKITPPTGLLENTVACISIVAISLVVIGGGTYIIKKKVLGR